MNDLSPAKRLTVTEDLILGFGRGVRMRHDDKRDAWVLMAPERVLVLDDVAYAILSTATEKRRTVGTAIDVLAEEVGEAPGTIRADVLEFLQALADKRFLTT